VIESVDRTVPLLGLVYEKQATGDVREVTQAHAGEEERQRMWGRLPMRDGISRVGIWRKETAIQGGQGWSSSLDRPHTSMLAY